MALILNIETSGRACSVALGKDGNLIALKESVEENYSHFENLTAYIHDVFNQANLKIKDIDAVSVSKGPGSYTGLRIGVSAAKGICFALDKPLIGVETLRGMARSQMKYFPEKSFLLCPMLDARRMEVYCAVYNPSLVEIKKTTAEIIDENSFEDILLKNVILFFGDGAEKCKKFLGENPNAKFLDFVFPSARNLISLSEELFNSKKFEDVAYFEPFYLKDFVGTKSVGE